MDTFVKVDAIMDRVARDAWQGVMKLANLLIIILALGFFFVIAYLRAIWIALKEIQSDIRRIGEDGKYE